MLHQKRAKLTHVKCLILTATVQWLYGQQALRVKCGLSCKTELYAWKSVPAMEDHNYTSPFSFIPRHAGNAMH